MSYCWISAPLISIRISLTLDPSSSSALPRTSAPILILLRFTSLFLLSLSSSTKQSWSWPELCSPPLVTQPPRTSRTRCACCNTRYSKRAQRCYCLSRSVTRPPDAPSTCPPWRKLEPSGPHHVFLVLSCLTFISSLVPNPSHPKKKRTRWTRWQGFKGKQYSSVMKKIIFSQTGVERHSRYNTIMIIVDGTMYSVPSSFSQKFLGRWREVLCGCKRHTSCYSGVKCRGIRCFCTSETWLEEYFHASAFHLGARDLLTFSLSISSFNHFSFSPSFLLSFVTSPFATLFFLLLLSHVLPVLCVTLRTSITLSVTV